MLDTKFLTETKMPEKLVFQASSNPSEQVVLDKGYYSLQSLWAPTTLAMDSFQLMRGSSL